MILGEEGHFREWWKRDSGGMRWWGLKGHDVKLDEERRLLVVVKAVVA